MVMVDTSLMLSEAERCKPLEACGVVLCDGTVVAITNVAKRTGIFIMDTAELVAVYEQHGDIDGVWHSHPNGDENPSPADVDAHPSGKMMFIATPAGVVYHGRPGQATPDLVSEGAGELGKAASLHVE